MQSNSLLVNSFTCWIFMWVFILCTSVCLHTVGITPSLTHASRQFDIMLILFPRTQVTGSNPDLVYALLASANLVIFISSCQQTCITSTQCSHLDVYKKTVAMVPARLLQMSTVNENREYSVLH